MGPLLNDLAPTLASGFEASRQGCFLWATDAVLREFSEGAEFVDKETSDAVYHFFEQQAVIFLRILNELAPTELPDVIEDFFRLLSDAVRFYPEKAILSPLADPMMESSLTALTLQQIDPVSATLHYLRDIISFGTDKPMVSAFEGPDGKPLVNPPEIQAAVRVLLLKQGPIIVQRVLTGMMFSFPEDCFADASSILLAIFGQMPHEAAEWVQATIQMLPAGTLKPAEANKLMKNIAEKINEDPRKVRVILQDFTNSYRRRVVAPREGLGRLEASRFRFTG